MYIVLYNTSMPKPMNISAARKDLPSLFDRVIRRTGEMVVIRRRDEEREAVLVSRQYVQSLLLKDRRAAPASQFLLVGSGEALSDVEAAVSEIRAAQESETNRRSGEMVRARNPGQRR